MSAIYNRKLLQIIAPDSAELFTALSAPPKYIDHSIFVVVSVILFEYKRECANKMIWICGKAIWADHETKPDSPLDNALWLFL